MGQSGIERTGIERTGDIALVLLSSCPLALLVFLLSSPFPSHSLRQTAGIRLENKENPPSLLLFFPSLSPFIPLLGNSVGL